MIQLSFIKPYRSISEFPSIDLPDFTIITGINGSGKSHLLEAIDNQSIKAEGIILDSGQIRRFDWNNLVPKSENAVDPNHLMRVRMASIENAVNFSSNIKQNVKAAVDRLSDQLRIKGFPLKEGKNYLELNESFFRELAGEGQDGHWAHFKRVIDQTIHTHMQRQLAHNSPESNFTKYLQSACQKRGVSFLNLSAQEIGELIPIDWSQIDLFQHNLSELFAAYHRAWEENLQHDYYNKTYNYDYKIYTQDEFRQHFGEPPWELFNKILKEAGLDFRATYPEGRADLMFQAKLKNLSTGAEIQFKDFSSGEKIIASFALCTYRVQREILKVDNYPKLLLFDEIDAPLHPSMAKGLVSAINNVLVKERGVKVILTTHSPATISFAPEESLFRLEKNPRRLISCKKEEAIQLLTSGYIAVTNNSRFIITEAQQDRLFYTAIYEKLVERKILKVYPNLVFVPADVKKDRETGGREKVKQWSQKLSQAGLKQIFGLIDRDEGNVPNGTVKVLKRYSFENYVLDPINVYAVLINERKHKRILDIGIQDLDYRQLRDASSDQLQNIAEAICKTVEASFPLLAQNSKNPFEVEYICGKKIRLPGWMRDHRGHDLVSLYRDCFKNLFRDFILTKNECEDLVSMLTERLPDFISVELVDTLKELCP